MIFISLEETQLVQIAVPPKLEQILVKEQIFKNQKIVEEIITMKWEGDEQVRI